MEYYRSLDAANLDPDFPTVFELLASRQLNGLVNPSIRHILVHYAQAHPQYLLRIVNKYDELYLIIFGVVEYLHLKNWNSSFTERFYGIKRTAQLPVPSPRTKRTVPHKVDPLRRLSRKQVWGSLIAAVVLPYMREKAQARFERLQGRYAFRSIEEDRPPVEAPVLDHWKYQANIALLKWFPRVTFALNASEVLFTAFYLFKGSGPSSLTDYTLQMQYSRLSQWDYDEHDARTKHGRLRILKVMLNQLGFALPTALFVLKFFEWWNSSNFAQKLASSRPDLPPPQIQTEPTLSGCPICGREDPETPAALETGVVYCYKCIWDHLQDLDPTVVPTCPATGQELLLTSWNNDSKQWNIGGIRRIMI